ncbi:MAG: serine/threonine-protein kinase [Planctomycetota bacterium]
MLGQLGSYTILEELGRGGMGAVYRARHEPSGRTVAIKRLLPELLTNPELLERFRREGLALRGVEHPNLVTVLDGQLVGPAPFLVFEFVDGPTLRARVAAEGPLPWRTAVRVLGEVAAGLSAAHDRQVLHRDLKPDNVLLGPTGAKLADFGLAKPLDKDSLTHSEAGILGTASYLAPEQALDPGGVSRPSVDTYALAGTLYFALTGRDPFRGSTPLKTLEAVLHAPPPAPRRVNRAVPRWLDAVVQRGLAKDPRARYPTAVAFRAALRAPDAPGRRPARVALALVACACAIAGAWAWSRGTPSPQPVAAPAPARQEPPSGVPASPLQSRSPLRWTAPRRPGPVHGGDRAPSVAGRRRGAEPDPGHPGSLSAAAEDPALSVSARESLASLLARRLADACASRRFEHDPRPPSPCSTWPCPWPRWTRSA